MKLLSMTVVAAFFASAAFGQGYRQLVDLSTLNGGDGANINSAAIIGDDAYVTLSGNGQHRIVKVEDVGGANVVSTVVDTATWNTTVGTAASGISGTAFASGTDLLVLDNTTDQVVRYDTTNGTASLLVDNATIGGSVTFGGLDNSDGNLLIYQSSSDTLLKTTGAVNGVTTVLTDTEIASIAGDDTPSGVAADSAGVIYFGQTTASVGEDITFFDPSGPTSGTYLTEEQIVGSGNDVGFSTTAFEIFDDVLFFRDGGTNDAILSTDLSAATATAVTVLNETQLVNGPATSDFVGTFASLDGQLAWVQFLGSGGQTPGIYAIPEPTAATLLGLGGLALLRRQRAA